jgi:peroxiredoxin
MKRLLLSAIATALLTTHVFAQALVGQPAPEFNLTSLDDGEKISLVELRDKVVYIYFYGAYCVPCYSNGEITETNIYGQFKDNPNFVALGLDTWNESKLANRRFRSRTNISYSLLLNAQETLIDYYNDELSYNRSVVISGSGQLAYKGTIFSDSTTEKVTTVINDELSKVSTSAEQTENIPQTISLQQNYPNPFNPSTVITYTLNEATQVSLKVFNMLGSEVATVVKERQSAGEKSVTWNAMESSGSVLPSGLYIYQLKAGGDVITKKMTLIK